MCVCVRVYMCASTSACTCACSLERLLVLVHVFKSECGTRWSLTQASAQIDKSCSARCHFHLHQQLPRIREHARPPSDRPPPSKNYERRNESWPSRMAVCSCFRRTSSHVYSCSICPQLSQCCAAREQMHVCTHTRTYVHMCTHRYVHSLTYSTGMACVFKFTGNACVGAHARGVCVRMWV